MLYRYFFPFTRHKRDISHFSSFSRCVFPLCLPVVFPVVVPGKALGTARLDPDGLSRRDC